MHEPPVKKRVVKPTSEKGLLTRFTTSRVALSIKAPYSIS